jgi:anti-sigma factor RsiW
MSAAHLPDALLQRYVDHLLSPQELELAEAHLRTCPECAALAEEYRSLFGDLAQLPEPAPPPRFTQAVMARVAAHDRDLARQRQVAIATFAGSLTLALLCFVAAGNHAWAHEVSAWSASLVELGRSLHVLVAALGPVLEALRLPLIVACACLSLPLLLVLHRSLPDRGLRAS